ncbi:MAG: DMT family transporter [Anaerovoracaceae bacterium]
MDTRKKERAANLLLLLVAIIWGGGFVAGKMALTGLSPAAILLYRFSMAALLCGICFFGRIRHTPKDTMVKGCMIGVLQMAAQAVQLIGLQYTTPAKQSFLCTAYVALVPFLSWIVLRKRPQPKALLAGFIALAGIGLISLRGSFNIGFGDGMSLGFAVLFGLQIVLVGRFVGNDADSIQLSFFQFLTASVIAGAACLMSGESMIPVGGESMAGILYLGVLNTFVAMAGQNVGQKYTRDTTASLIISLESLFGFTFSTLYYHEQMDWRMLTGGALCFAAILINTAERKNLLIKK